ncbi:TniQ family protein [Paraburkholderia sabiae]|uniref:TniQ family protein n=1 Tax=Paraburkholderia sabiae TaxID=273251 RepID=UPI0019183014|nr:hypothetical protein LMG24235_06849 [Paraburkholderia sabiae]
MAIALFPLLDGETIGSNLGRYADFIGLESTLPLRQRLFGYASRPETRLPSGIDHLAAEARDYWGLDTEAIINDHTEFRYATLTVSETQRKAMRSCMADQPVGRCLRRSVGGWSGEIVTRFRYCEECLLEWRGKAIAAHWKADHQLPGVYVCCIHSRMLKMTAPGSSENLTDPTVLALMRCADEEILTRLSLSERSAIEDLAKRSTQYRMTNDSLPSASAYRGLLSDAGFLRSCGKTDNYGFVASVLEYFGLGYCRLVGLNLQKMTVWLHNIVDRAKGIESCHPFMSIAAESLLNRLCASPGSFVPMTQNGAIDSDKSLQRDVNAVDMRKARLSCVGILHRKIDTWKECSREGTDIKLSCSCGVSYRMSNISFSETAQLKVETYGVRYQSLLSTGLNNDVRVKNLLQRPHTADVRFLRWARYAGFSKNTDVSNEEIQRMRDRWRLLVMSGRPDKRITSAHRSDSILYRTLSRYDRDWFVAFNLENRTRSKHSSTTSRIAKS